MANNAGFAQSHEYIDSDLRSGKNFKTVIGGRVMGGLSSAGGSVTLNMVADMFPAEQQQFAVL
jgi:hypothetical protein